MRKRLLSVSLVCAGQIGAVGLGVAWGLATAHGVRSLGNYWSLVAGLGILMLALDWLHYLASPRLRTANPVTPWICFALASYATWLMSVEAFLWYIGDESFIIGVMRLLPFLLAMSLLVRAGAWLGVAGSALFFGTSLAMLIRNGFSLNGGSGFFAGWVS